MKKYIIIIILILAIFLGLFLPSAIYKYKIVKAVSSLPYQIGLTSVVIVKCFTSGVPPICQGGTLCYTKDVATCTNYSDVSGTPAGGMGSNALFSNMAIGQAGLAPGGQLIAGGLSPTLMDNGILASVGGCYGCTAKAGLSNKIFAWIDKFFIAGFK